MAAPIFLVLHVGWDGRNFPAQALQSSGTRPVVTAEDGQPAVEGTVYVAPADQLCWLSTAA